MKRPRLPRAAVSVADFLLAGLASAAAAGPLAAWALLARARRRGRGAGRRLLVLDCAYSLAVMRERHMEHVVTSRDLDGFFEHVWYAHPLVGASPDDPPGEATGPVSVTKLGDRHTVVEGRVARFAAVSGLPT